MLFWLLAETETGLVIKHQHIKVNTTPKFNSISVTVTKFYTFSKLDSGISIYN